MHVKCAIPEKIQTGRGFEDILFWKNPETSRLCYITLGNSGKNKCWEFQRTARPKTKTPRNSIQFFLDHSSGNSTSFLINPWNPPCKFLRYPCPGNHMSTNISWPCRAYTIYMNHKFVKKTYLGFMVVNKTINTSS